MIYVCEFCDFMFKHRVGEACPRCGEIATEEKKERVESKSRQKQDKPFDQGDSK